MGCVQVCALACESSIVVGCGHCLCEVCMPVNTRGMSDSLNGQGYASFL